MVSEQTLMQEIAEMQKSVHYLQMRVKALSEENYKLKNQMRVLYNADIHVQEPEDRGSD